jgi:Ca-activated chloride channel family protein
VRTPGADGEAKVTKLAAGHYKVSIDRASGDLSHDFVFYYRLAENIPGRVELMAYKPKADEPGTFMLTVTPGSDLAPIGAAQSSGVGQTFQSAAEAQAGKPAPHKALPAYSESITVSSTAGADYVFVLDVSGSMSAKIGTLARGVKQALAQFRSGDRFRIFIFDSRATELTPGFVDANPQTVARWADRLQEIRPVGGTNVYEGLKAGLDAVEADRATSILFVTDGVTNEGIVDPRQFYALLKKYDVRIFGFLMGNNANWPLMRLITETSGGFYDAVSNDDDIAGAILLAKSKIVSEAMHDATLTVDGVKTFDNTFAVHKVFRGEQLVIFGRYDKGGIADVKLAAKMTGEDATYTTRFEFPDVSTSYPELERMWAMDRIEDIVMKETVGVMPAAESENAIRDLGIKYQLVTDYTSMVLLTDDTFAKRGIVRDNKQRVEIERKAQTARASFAPANHRVDMTHPMFNGPSHSIKGGGALDPISALMIFIAAFAVMQATRRERMG